MFGKTEVMKIMSSVNKLSLCKQSGLILVFWTCFPDTHPLIAISRFGLYTNSTRQQCVRFIICVWLSELRVCFWHTCMSLRHCRLKIQMEGVCGSVVWQAWSISEIRPAFSWRWERFDLVSANSTRRSRSSAETLYKGSTKPFITIQTALKCFSMSFTVCERGNELIRRNTRVRRSRLEEPRGGQWHKLALLFNTELITHYTLDPKWVDGNSTSVVWWMHQK